MSKGVRGHSPSRGGAYKRNKRYRDWVASNAWVRQREVKVYRLQDDGSKGELLRVERKGNLVARSGLTKVDELAKKRAQSRGRKKRG